MKIRLQNICKLLVCSSCGCAIEATLSYGIQATARIGEPSSPCSGRGSMLICTCRGSWVRLRRFSMMPPLPSQNWWTGKVSAASAVGSGLSVSTPKLWCPAARVLPPDLFLYKVAFSSRCMKILVPAGRDTHHIWQLIRDVNQIIAADGLFGCCFVVKLEDRGGTVEQREI